MLAINTLGVLYVLEKGDGVQSVSDLAGGTLLSAGQARPIRDQLHPLRQRRHRRRWVQVQHNEVPRCGGRQKPTWCCCPSRCHRPDDEGLGLPRGAGRDRGLLQAARLRGVGRVLSMGGLIVRKAFAEENPPPWPVWPPTASRWRPSTCGPTAPPGHRGRRHTAQRGRGAGRHPAEQHRLHRRPGHGPPAQPLLTRYSSASTPPRWAASCPTRASGSFRRTVEEARPAEG